MNRNRHLGKTTFIVLSLLLLYTTAQAAARRSTRNSPTTVSADLDLDTAPASSQQQCPDADFYAHVARLYPAFLQYKAGLCSRAKITTPQELFEHLATKHESGWISCPVKKCSKVKRWTELAGHWLKKHEDLLIEHLQTHFLNKDFNWAVPTSCDTEEYFHDCDWIELT